MTEHELAEMLHNNPDLRLSDDDLAQMQVRTDGRGDKHIKVPGKMATVIGRMTEHDLQAAVIAECDRRSLLRVEYGLIFAIPNGQYRQGQRMEPGLRAGVPDLFLPVARHGYHGLFIELKCGDNKPTEPQTNWLRHLKAEGYLCHVLRDDLKKVIGMIEWYLEAR